MAAADLLKRPCVSQQRDVSCVANYVLDEGVLQASELHRIHHQVNDFDEDRCAGVAGRSPWEHRIKMHIGLPTGILQGQAKGADFAGSAWNPISEAPSACRLMNAHVHFAFMEFGVLCPCPAHGGQGGPAISMSTGQSTVSTERL
jgi:hypothetical protein